MAYMYAPLRSQGSMKLSLTLRQLEAVRAEQSLRGRSRGHCLLCGGPETRDWVAV